MKKIRNKFEFATSEFSLKIGQKNITNLEKIIVRLWTTIER